MRKEVLFTNQFIEDADAIEEYICNQLFAPLTGERFGHTLIDFCISIGNAPHGNPLNRYRQLKQYGGSELRKATFRKKWTILYEVKGNYVIIQKILYSGSVISG